MSNRPLTEREVRAMFDASDRAEWNRVEKEIQREIRELHKLADRLEDIGNGR